ncbi:retinaldehyde-binding protein 1-like, partial [Stegodyphus dumicola]|uniref:retinaldehyde-binding protein 1-like n=1 Tax=Stegodyphus dumicola TaxID=202533 RepID=UPI0015AD9D3A
MDKETKAAKESFLAYPSTDLTPALQDYAATHLNETEEAKVKGLQAFNEILQKDFEVPFCEDIYILCFLRSKKFDVKKAAELFYRGTKFVDSHRNFFERPNSSEVVRRFLQANVIGFLSYRDNKSRAILYLRAEAWDPDQISADEAVFGAAISIFSAIENPVNQMAGMIIITDLKHLKLQQIIAFSSWIVLGTQALQ